MLRKHMMFFKYFSVFPLLFILLFCMLRILFPVELPFTAVINSTAILPFIQSFLCTPFFEYGSIRISLLYIISLIWLSGTLFVLLKHGRRYYRLRQLLNFLPATDNEHIYEILNTIYPYKYCLNIKIIVHDSVESPAIIGLINPVIIMPNVSFSDNELKGILIHEITHLRYGHSLVKYLAEFIHACFWWNPFFKELSLEVAHVLEMHSDKIVCKKISEIQQKDYLLGILKVLHNLKGPPSPSIFLCSLVEESSAEKLVQRFQMILNNNYKKKSKHDFVLIPCVFLCFLLSYAVVLQPYSVPSQKEYGNSESINSDDYLVKTETGYELYDSSDRFIANITHLDKSLKDLKIIYKTEEKK